MIELLNKTGRCKFIKDLSIAVWDSICQAHQVNMDKKEVGITADLIIEVLTFSNCKQANFDVYAKPGYKEYVSGSDMDVFVETGQNQYRWFALQAKVLKRNNRYTTLRDGYSQKNPSYQWEKLKKLEEDNLCKGYFLLYNGKNENSCYNMDWTGVGYDKKLLGCSLVKLNDIETFALKRGKNGKYINPTFEDIHPKSAMPWAKLVCCCQDDKDFTTYSLSEIIESNPNIKDIRQRVFDDSSSSDDEENTKMDFKKVATIPNVEGNRINEAYRKTEWNPALRIIIKTDLTAEADPYNL